MVSLCRVLLSLLLCENMFSCLLLLFFCLRLRIVACTGNSSSFEIPCSDLCGFLSCKNVVEKPESKAPGSYLHLVLIMRIHSLQTTSTARAVANICRATTTKVGLQREAQRGKEAPSLWRTSYVPASITTQAIFQLGFALDMGNAGLRGNLADQLSSTQWFTLKRSPLVQVSRPHHKTDRLSCRCTMSNVHLLMRHKLNLNRVTGKLWHIR